MSWGVFDFEECCHVAPMNDSTSLLRPPHEFTTDCKCHPTLQFKQNEDGVRAFIIHEEIH